MTETISVYPVECKELELKPCPFCGNSVLVIKEEKFSNGRTEEWVECCNQRCGAMGPMWRKTRSHRLVIKYWNQRVKE